MNPSLLLGIIIGMGAVPAKRTSKANQTFNEAVAGTVIDAQMKKQTNNTVPPVPLARLVRRCPKCGHGRWRHVGEIARVGISTSGKAWREVEMKIVECMKCDHSWDILTEDSESGPTNANVDLPDTAAQDSASKTNSPAVSG
jgi:DNA-directed RNA polymerase subunit M/transcription elongation factor TFIIS